MTLTQPFSAGPPRAVARARRDLAARGRLSRIVGSSAALSGTALGRLRALPPLDGMTVHGQSVVDVFGGRQLYRDIDAELLKQKARELYRLPRDPGLLPKPVEIPVGPFVKSARPLCVSVGRLDPRKRPRMFLELAAGLPDLELLGFVDPFTDDRPQRTLNEVWMLGAVAEESGGEALHRAVRTLIDSGAWRANGPADRRYNAEHHAVDVSVAAHLR